MIAFDQIRHLLIDLDGVLYRGTATLPAAQDFVAWLRRRNIAFRLVTNNATLTPAQYVSKLAVMGIEVQTEEVFTSALATALHMRKHDASGQDAYVIGEDGILAALEDIGMRITERDPEWVVVGLDRQLTYQKLAVAALAIQRGAHFIGTNPDTSFPAEHGLVPGAGAIQAALTATTGVQATVIGKPQPLMLQLAIEQMGGSVTDTAMLGDRLDTDIKGAEVLSLQSILVLTGVSTRQELETGAIRPSLVVNNLRELMDTWSHSTQRN
jgi:4-nitrophenyl phosphatase